MGQEDIGRGEAEALSVARDLLLSQSCGRVAPEQILLGHYQVEVTSGDRPSVVVEATLPSWCGVNGGEVFARVLVPRDPTDGDPHVEWIDLNDS